MFVTDSWSIGRKVTTAVVAVVTVGCITLISLEARWMGRSLTEAFENHSVSTSDLLASTVEGGVRWKKPQSVERAYLEFVSQEGSIVSSLVVWDVDSQLLSQYQSSTLPVLDLVKTIEDPGKLDTEVRAKIHYPDHFVVIEPVLIGKDNNWAGAIAIAFSKQQLKRQITELLIFQSALAGGILLVLTGCVVFLLRSIVTQPLTRAVDAMVDVAQGHGNLAHRLDQHGSDEMAQLAGGFNRFADKIKGVVDLVVDSSTALAGEAGRMSEVTERSKQQVTSQQSMLREVASDVDDMSVTLSEVAGSAAAAADAANEAKQNANEGREVVNQVWMR